MRHRVCALLLALTLVTIAHSPARGTDEPIDTPQRCMATNAQGLPALRDGLTPWDAGPSSDVYLLCLGSPF
jgi:hypothetical protein